MRLVRLTGLFLAFILLFSVGNFAFAAKPAGNFDTTRTDLGSVGTRYVPTEDKRVKTRVQSSSDTYDYDLFGRENFEYFPLQMGNGLYKVSIFQNISGTRYRQVKSENVKAEMDDPLAVYKASIQTVCWNEDMEVIKKARELTKGLKSDTRKIEAIYGYVIDALSYDYDKIKNIETTYVPDIEKVIKAGKGICYDYSAVFAAMLRSCGIPAKLIKGYTDNVKGYHAWNEVYLSAEKRWIVVDTTYDSVMKKSGITPDMEKDSKKYKASREY